MSRLSLLLPALALLLFAPLACTAEQEDAGSSEAAGSDTAASAQTGQADGATSASTEEVRQRIRSRLREERPDIEITSVRTTPVPQIYEIVAEGRVYYVTPEAQYLFTGNLIDLEAGRNVTEQRQAELAHELVDDLDPERMVVFEPANGPAEKYITVFTDTTCRYCRRLHQEVLSLVEEYPVEVRYAMFPRAGIDSSAAEILRNVWCADDPASAMTRAKQGESIEQRADGCEPPIDQHLAIANRIGVRGTPYMLIGDDGPVVPGYRPKRELVSMLGFRPKQ